MKTVHHVIVIPADVDEIFAAITTEEGLSVWWTTKVAAPPAETASFRTHC